MNSTAKFLVHRSIVSSLIRMFECFKHDCIKYRKNSDYIFLQPNPFRIKTLIRSIITTDKVDFHGFKTFMDDDLLKRKRFIHTRESGLKSYSDEVQDTRDCYIWPKGN